MADDERQDTSTPAEAADTPGDTPAAPAKKAAAKKSTAKKAATKKSTAKKATAKKAATAPVADPAATEAEATQAEATDEKPAKKAAAKKSTAKKAASKRTTKKAAPVDDAATETAQAAETAETAQDAPASGTMPLFQVPEKTPVKRTRSRATTKVAPAPEPVVEEPVIADPVAEDDEETLAQAALEVEATIEAPADPVADAADGSATSADSADDDSAGDDSEDTDNTEDTDDDGDSAEGGDSGPRRRRRRGGRRRRRTGSGDGGDESGDDSGTAQDPDEAEAKADSPADDSDGEGDGGSGTTTRRRRKRRREGDDSGSGDDPSNTTTRVRRVRSAEDEITSIQGSTRLEAKKQRRRDGREAGRRRAPIVSEAEFLARREAVDRVMVVRQRDELTQIGVLEDKVLVEHYVARESQTSLIGNIYLGRVQNVLPSMEAAFIDIGKGRNAVIYAGEVNWQQLGHKDGQPRKIESVLSSGQTILVQVSKDPVGHKGARLTSQISLAGRFLVYVPDGTTSGISRKLPDTERHRLKTLLKEVVPSTAGVIVRTAAEGASEEELTQDVERLKARWEEIEAKAKSRGGNPQLLHGEPDLTLKVVRDLFTEDFGKLVIQGTDVWDTVHGYVDDMAPDLIDRVERYDPAEHNGVDLFSTYRIDEQIAKALDRKVFLPSGGSLVIDRTEAMTVVDVNTGKFTGSGGNLEETVTKNNLEAAEEVVRQLRLRDIGGIIVVDFIDMVLEANRDLVLRRMVECLGRDRTRHQVAEVTSLGLVQMTRKRIGTGLLEAFSVDCDHCHGRGVVVHDVPIEKRGSSDEGGGRGGNGGNGGNGGGRGNSHTNARGGNDGDGDSDGDRRGRRRGRGRGDDASAAPVAPQPAHKPTPAEFAAMAKAEVHRAEQADRTERTERTERSTTVDPVVENPAPAEPAEPAEPKVVTRTRRGVSRTVTTAAVAPVEVATPTPAEQQDTEASTPVTPDAEPKVVTRTRRGVSRTVTTAAPAAAEAEPAPEAPQAPEQAAEQTAAPSSEPRVVTRRSRGVSRTVTTAAVAPVEVVAPAAAPPADPESAPEPPRVVTRTRGGARRTPPAAEVPESDQE